MRVNWWQETFRLAKHLGEEQGAELYRQVEDIAGAVIHNDYRALGRTDLEFLRAVWRSAGNATLYQILDQLAAPLFALFLRPVLITDRLEITDKSRTKDGYLVTARMPLSPSTRT